MDINFIYTLKRREFGKPCTFTDVGPHILVDIDSDQNLKDQFYTLPTVDREIDNSVKMCAHEVNTVVNTRENRGMNHTEGGWPASVDILDEDSTTRFRKKVDKDKNYHNTVKTLSDFLESYIMENNSIDIYETYFPGEQIKCESERPFTVINIFKDPINVYRCVMDICFSNDSSKFAAAYNLIKSKEPLLNIPLDCYVWDIENCVSPFCILNPEMPISCIEFSPTDPNVLLAGYSNGQIALWDIRIGGHAQQLSPVHVSHSQKVTGVKWLHTSSGMSFFSASVDGTISSWNAGNLNSPTETVELDPAKGDIPNLEKVYSVCCLEYDPTLPNTFMLGTEHGEILAFNRRFTSSKDMLQAQYKSLNGPVLGIERNAFFPQLFATCDAWAAKIWLSEVVDSPILTLMSRNGFYTDLTWNPLRASVLYLTKSTGEVELWDIPGKNSQPMQSIKLEDKNLLCVSANESGRNVVCGSISGSIHLLQVPEYFQSISEIEMQLVSDSIDDGGDITEVKTRRQRVSVLETKRAETGADNMLWDEPERAEDLYEEYLKFFPPEM